VPATRRPRRRALRQWHRSRESPWKPGPTSPSPAPGATVDHSESSVVDVLEMPPSGLLHTALINSSSGDSTRRPLRYILIRGRRPRSVGYRRPSSCSERDEDAASPMHPSRTARFGADRLAMAIIHFSQITPTNRLRRAGAPTASRGGRQGPDRKRSRVHSASRGCARRRAGEPGPHPRRGRPAVRPGRRGHVADDDRQGGGRRHRHALPPLPHPRGPHRGDLPQRDGTAGPPGRRAARRAGPGRRAPGVDGRFVDYMLTKQGMSRRCPPSSRPAKGCAPTVATSCAPRSTASSAPPSRPTCSATTCPPRTS
jgi:hypothetical protein